MPAVAAEWAGRTLFGKWKVERRIGVGGTSTVLLARHRNGRRAALKVLHPHLAAHERTRQRFVREGRLANLVDHPGVVAVLDDFVTEDGNAVLVLEYVDGQNLGTRAKSLGGVLDPREVVEAACSVLDILAVAHDAGVIHRDVKPDNVLYRSGGGYKLADFGLAGLGHELGMFTGTGVALGTPAYMSPEQARADTREIDARTDLWALGATMFTLLTGRFLHSGSAPRNLVVAAATEAVPPVRSLAPEIPAGLAEIIDRAVRMDREERWPNARAMLVALSALELPTSVLPPRVGALDDAGAPTAPSTMTSWSRPATWLRAAEARSSWLPRGAAAMALAFAVAVAGVALSAPDWGRAGWAGVGEARALAPKTPPMQSTTAAPLPQAEALSELRSHLPALPVAPARDVERNVAEVGKAAPRKSHLVSTPPQKRSPAPVLSVAPLALPQPISSSAAPVESASQTAPPKSFYRH
jgi:eukaryotic-like serine/threonine-protein kinase